jgi:hypothetical protein
MKRMVSVLEKPAGRQEKRRRRRRHGAGFTIPSFAEHYDLPVGQVRRAVARGDIKTVPFAGLERITPSEAERIAELFGLKSRDDPNNNETRESRDGVDHKDTE